MTRFYLSKTFSLFHPMKSALLVGAFALAVSATLFSQQYTRTDLTADVAATSATAANLDPNLVNAWGLSRSAGSPWWISDNGAGLSTLYDGAGVPQTLVVKIPTPNGSGTATPTGTVFNYTTGFQVSGKPSVFLFVTEDGTIAGWNPTVNLTNAVIVKNRAGKAIFKGCTLAQTKQGQLLFVTDFVSRRVYVYDANFHRLFFHSWAFRDPEVPGSYAPFNIQNVGGNLVVTFAKVESGSTDEKHGAGLGYVSVFDTEGRLIQRLKHGSWLNAPWGIAATPGDFGAFSHRILIGNFGDGHVNAFNSVTGKFEGQLLDATNKPLAIDGLWALSFGNNGGAGSALELYFTAGPNDESNGLLGKIAPVATDQRGNNE
jgi:uncharacterized protein (TIGR03118 family)